MRARRRAAPVQGLNQPIHRLRHLDPWLDDAADQSKDNYRPKAGCDGDMIFDALDRRLAHGRIGVGEGEPLLTPGLACSDGRNPQLVSAQHAPQRRQIKQARLADGKLNPVIAQAGDALQVRLQIAFKGCRLETGGLGRENNG